MPNVVMDVAKLEPMGESNYSCLFGRRQRWEKRWIKVGDRDYKHGKMEKSVDR